MTVAPIPLDDGTPRRAMTLPVPSGNTPRGKLLRLTAAAERLDVSERTVKRLVRAGRLRTVKIGRRTLVPETELDRFIDDLQEVA